MIFSQKELIFLTLCRRNFSTLLEWRSYFEKSISQKKILLVDTSTEESNLYKMWALDMEVYFTRTLTYPNNSTGKESFPHWFNGRGAINSLFYTKIATSAVSLAQILLPKKVLPISFWEQCSHAPPLFPPLVRPLVEKSTNFF